MKILDCGCSEDKPCHEHSTVAERHNAYAWVKPDAIVCHLCGKKEYITPVDGFQIKDCDRCARPICEECAEVDYDGDSEGFRNTQWQCGNGRTKALVQGTSRAAQSREAATAKQLSLGFHLPS